SLFHYFIISLFHYFIISLYQPRSTVPTDRCAEPELRHNRIRQMKRRDSERYLWQDGNKNAGRMTLYH
ncbi:hypothetical protein, partial [Morganella morganii]|uniref:hypothetical protein n=1 Tax=Morganella morganii TaxID=582 RepID=UPI001D148691